MLQLLPQQLSGLALGEGNVDKVSQRACVCKIIILTDSWLYQMHNSELFLVDFLKSISCKLKTSSNLHLNIKKNLDNILKQFLRQKGTPSVV